MKKVTAINELTGRIIEHELRDDFYEFFIQDRTEKGKFGKVARWIPLTLASEFEQSREDDRREYLEPGMETPIVEIHVPDDFTVTIEDITAQYEFAQKRDLNIKKFPKCFEVISHISALIDAYTTEQRLTLLSNPGIKQAKEFLQLGSLIQSRDMISVIAVDTLVTQEFKDSVIDFINLKISEL
jgi:hypothetical protein